MRAVAKPYMFAGLTYQVLPGGRFILRCPDCGLVQLASLSDYLVAGVAKQANEQCSTCGQVVFPHVLEDDDAWAPCVDAWKATASEIVAQKQMRIITGRLQGEPYRELRTVLAKRYPELAQVCGWAVVKDDALRDKAREVAARQGQRLRDDRERYARDVLGRLDNEVRVRLAIFTALLELDARTRSSTLYTKEGLSLLEIADKLLDALDGRLALPPGQTPADLIPDSVRRISDGVAVAAGRKIGELVAQRVEADKPECDNLA